MKLITLFLFIGCVFGGDIVTKHTGESAWDELIDQGIDAARSDIIDNHFDLINLPDLNKEFHKKIIGISFHTTVKIQDAQVWNISTVKRRGPTTVLQDDVAANITISTSLGLDKLVLNCNKLYLKVIGITVSGSMNIDCSSNELEISLSLITDKQNTCRAHVNWARLTKFHDFTVQIAPKLVTNWFAKHIISFILNVFSYKIIGFINLSLADKLNAAIGNIDVCSYLPLS
uniref:Putative secreted protein n=1 Tax=Triatoma dimidiata TaxID=72491 RepID=A0A0V0GBA6_TRIDM